MATPRDIALAIRIRPSGSEQSTGEESNNEEERERMEDLFDEIGMEYMDESSLPEDDDERRESSLSFPFTSYTMDLFSHRTMGVTGLVEGSELGKGSESESEETSSRD